MDEETNVELNPGFIPGFISNHILVYIMNLLSILMNVPQKIVLNAITLIHPRFDKWFQTNKRQIKGGKGGKSENTIVPVLQPPLDESEQLEKTKNLTLYILQHFKDQDFLDRLRSNIPKSFQIIIDDIFFSLRTNPIISRIDNLPSQLLSLNEEEFEEILPGALFNVSLLLRLSRLIQAQATPPANYQYVKESDIRNFDRRVSENEKDVIRLKSTLDNLIDVLKKLNLPSGFGSGLAMKPAVSLKRESGGKFYWNTDTANVSQKAKIAFHVT